MADKIIIKNLKIFANHGVNPEEKRDGQTFYIDMELDVDLTKPCHSDDVNDTVNYDEVCNLAYSIMTENTFDLIERAAQAVCCGILKNFDRVESIDLTLKKPEAPVKCDIEYAAVRIFRSRKDIVL